jgi:two-component system response regulator HydG
MGVTPFERRPIVLVVDKEPEIVTLVQRLADPQGFDVVGRADGQALLAELRALRADAALVDLHTPGVNGLGVIKAIHDATPACHVILMAPPATPQSAIEAVKLGALDCLRKPLDVDRLGALLTVIRGSLDRRKLLLAVDGEMASRFEFHGMIGRSAVMQELFDAIRRLAPHARTALVTGETGTGKELVARAIHELSGRQPGPFTACNCAAIAETLFESEFFGHTRGAFTGANQVRVGLFEAADGGTLFLDEIGELPPATQAKLLRVVEYGEMQRVGTGEIGQVNVRVIAATTRRLHEAAGRFRPDLLHRLSAVEIVLPPLRDRADDITYLSASFVNEFAERFHKPLVGISAAAERVLRAAPWPGNVRELRHTLERACLLSEGRMLSERDVLAAIRVGRGRPAEPLPRPARQSFDRDALLQALHGAGGNKSVAARTLGVSRRAFYRRLESAGLQ